MRVHEDCVHRPARRDLLGGVSSFGPSDRTSGTKQWIAIDLWNGELTVERLDAGALRISGDPARPAPIRFAADGLDLMSIVRDEQDLVQ